MPSKKATKFRPLDFYYDPLFLVSGRKDLMKVAIHSQMTLAKFQVCPTFNSMFTDIPHRKNSNIIVRRKNILDFRNQQQVATKPLDIQGTDRYKFFAFPIANKLCADIIKPPNNTPVSTPTTVPPLKLQTLNKKIQTQYRESSAQTSPWQPDFTVINGDPELLYLDFLKWHSGLPAGLNEVELIERARMKRAWLNSTTNLPLEARNRIIESLELDEWAFRENEIQEIQNLRLELLKKMLEELHEKSNNRTEMKMKKFCQLKEEEKNEKLAKLRHHTEREMRKLKMKSLGVNKKYHSVNIITEHGDKKSELYGPCMRHGDHPKRWHAIIDERLQFYRAQFIGVENFNTLPRKLEEATKLYERDIPKLPGTRLCTRETKWTMPVLKMLHEELKNLRQKTPKRRSKLKSPICNTFFEIETPEVEGIIDNEENMYESIVLIQAVLRGRASQSLIYDGRNRCRELIQELRSTHSLCKKGNQLTSEARQTVFNQQRDNYLQLKAKTCFEEVLNRLQSIGIGTLLDFLHKELRRLHDERKTHAMCLIAERERNNREAAEEGRRQVELRRRLEHDEMFKQIVKIRQESVDLYLQDIVTEGLDFATNKDAEAYVVKLATKVDERAYNTTINTLSVNDEEELVADLVHNLILPEVEKEIIRGKAESQRKKYLSEAHKFIYRAVEVMPPPPPSRRKKRKKLGKVQLPQEEEESIISETSTTSSIETISGSSDSIGVPVDLLSTKVAEPLQLIFTRGQDDEFSCRLSVYTGDQLDRMTIVTVDTLFHFLKRDEGTAFLPRLSEISGMSDVSLITKENIKRLLETDEGQAFIRELQDAELENDNKDEERSPQTVKTITIMNEAQGSPKDTQNIFVIKK